MFESIESCQINVLTSEMTICREGHMPYGYNLYDKQVNFKNLTAKKTDRVWVLM